MGNCGIWFRVSFTPFSQRGLRLFGSDSDLSITVVGGARLGEPRWAPLGLRFVDHRRRWGSARLEHRRFGHRRRGSGGGGGGGGGGDGGEAAAGGGVIASK